MNNSPYLAYYDFYDKIAKQAANGNEYVLTEDIEQLKEITTKTISEDAENLILNANVLVASVVWLKPLFGWKSNDDLPFKTYGSKQYATMKIYKSPRPSFINDNLSFMLKLIEHKIINVVQYFKQTKKIKFNGIGDFTSVDFLVGLGKADLNGMFCKCTTKNVEFELYCALMLASKQAESSKEDAVLEQRKEYVRLVKKFNQKDYVIEIAQLPDRQLLNIPLKLLNNIITSRNQYQMPKINEMTKYNLEKTKCFLTKYIEAKKKSTHKDCTKRRSFECQYFNNALSCLVSPPEELYPSWDFYLLDTLEYASIYGELNIPTLMKYQIINGIYKEWCQVNSKNCEENMNQQMKDYFCEYISKYNHIIDVYIDMNDIENWLENCMIQKNGGVIDSQEVLYISNGEYSLVKSEHDLQLDLNTNILNVMRNFERLLSVI